MLSFGRVTVAGVQWLCPTPGCVPADAVGKRILSRPREGHAVERTGHQELLGPHRAEAQADGVSHKLGVGPRVKVTLPSLEAWCMARFRRTRPRRCNGRDGPRLPPTETIEAWKSGPDFAASKPTFPGGLGSAGLTALELAPCQPHAVVAIAAVNAAAPGTVRRRSEPRASIAMATFNGAEHVVAQLETIAAQSMLPTEVVVVDDHSDDDTAGICQLFSERAPFELRVLRNASNLGPVRTFERALRECRGEYVFLSDQDDAWHADKLFTMVAAMDASPRSVLAIHDLRICDGTMRPIGETKMQRLAKLGSASRGHVTAMATVVRRSFLEHALPVPSPDVITHDGWLHECARALGLRLVIAKVLADYRRHESAFTVGSVVNAPGTTSLMSLTRDRLRKQGSERLDAQQTLFANVACWLTERRNGLVDGGFASFEDLDRTGVTYRNFAQWAAERRTLLQRPRSLRWRDVIVQFLRGKYRPFSGWRSAAKDILQP